jgi:hypothetical protein
MITKREKASVSTINKQLRNDNKDYKTNKEIEEYL